MFMGPTCLIPSGIDPAMPKTTWPQDARRQTVWKGSTVAVQDVDEMQKEFFALAALKQRIADLQGLIAEKEFRIVDADGDGKLSKKELANAMPSASATEVHTLSPQTQMRARLITVPVILRSHARTHNTNCHDAQVEARFKAMDTDGDGSISLAEYAAKVHTINAALPQCCPSTRSGDEHPAATWSSA